MDASTVIFARGIATSRMARVVFVSFALNRGGKLTARYGAPAALQIDPIEKKTVEPFSAGHACVSMGTAGCNMGCFFCQNWTFRNRTRTR